MKELGNTFEDVLKDGVFGPDEVDTLRAKWRHACEITNDSEFELMLGSSTTEGEFMYAPYVLLEDSDDIDQMIMDTGCDDIRLSVPADSTGFDAADYLNSSETIATLMLVTSNDGGTVYVVPTNLLNEFPSIHAHIFASNS
jgi:hypothetical protein